MSSPAETVAVRGPGRRSPRRPIAGVAIAAIIAVLSIGQFDLSVAGSATPASRTKTKVARLTNLRAPVVSGKTIVGQTLKTTRGKWAGHPTRWTYHWELCNPHGRQCANLKNARTPTYQLTTQTVGHTIRTIVTATARDKPTATATSHPTHVITQAHGDALPPVPMPLISRDPVTGVSVPVYYPGGPADGDTRSALNDGRKDSTTAGTYFGFLCPRTYADGGCYAAENLSSVSAVRSGKLSRVYVMYDNGVNYRYDPAMYAAGDSGILYAFTIDVACQALATRTLPGSGWVTKVSVTANTLRSRSFLISMRDTTKGGRACHGNYNWIRVSASSGAPNGWQNWQGTLDVWNASATTDDTWMMYGDSITANDSEDQDQPWGNSFAKQINAWNNQYYPALEVGAYGGMTALDYTRWLFSSSLEPGQVAPGSTPWLPKEPAHFIALNLGTNDCSGITGTYRSSLETLVSGILSADPTRVVIIPTLPASPYLRAGTNTVNIYGSGPTTSSDSYQPQSVQGSGQGPVCNRIIGKVIAAEKTKWGATHVMAGPDLWNATIVPDSDWGDGLHPGGDQLGMGLMRSAWVAWAEAHIYS